MRARKDVVFEETIDHVDMATGHQIFRNYRKVYTVKRDPSDSFSMIYAKNISDLVPKLSKKATAILLWLCEDTTLNTGCFTLGSSKRLELCSKFDMKNSQLSMCLKELREINLLKKVDNVTWFVNPEYLWRGELKQREGVLKAWYSLSNELPQEEPV